MEWCLVSELLATGCSAHISVWYNYTDMMPCFHTNISANFIAVHTCNAIETGMIALYVYVLNE